MSLSAIDSRSPGRIFIAVFLGFSFHLGFSPLLGSDRSSIQSDQFIDVALNTSPLPAGGGGESN